MAGWHRNSRNAGKGDDRSLQTGIIFVSAPEQSGDLPPGKLIQINLDEIFALRRASGLKNHSRRGGSDDRRRAKSRASPPFASVDHSFGWKMHAGCRTSSNAKSFLCFHVNLL